MKWSISVTYPSLLCASRFAYSAFLIECIDTASVMVSTKPEVAPRITMRKLNNKVLWFYGKLTNQETHYRTQHGQFSSVHIRWNSRMSCTANCSCRKSPPVLTITDTQSQFANGIKCQLGSDRKRQFRFCSTGQRTHQDVHKAMRLLSDSMNALSRASE